MEPARPIYLEPQIAYVRMYVVIAQLRVLLYLCTENTRG